MKDLPVYEYLTELTKRNQPYQAVTRYDMRQRPWMNNINDRVAYDHEFASGYPERMRIAQALISQSPLTPEKEIRSNMTVRNSPSRFGYPDKELTITEILHGNLDNTEAVKIFHVNDFSGTSGETNSSARNYQGIW